MTPNTHHDHDFEHEGEGLSVRQLARTMRNYRTVIRLAMAALLILFVLLASVVYLLTPAQNVTQLEFRLTFRGAEKGEYPTGTKFSSAEIISPPVLAAVYKQNDLSRFIDYDDFKSSLVVVQSNDALESLARTYKAKLADAKLTAVERERLEEEYQEKRSSLSKSDYSIAMVTHDALKKLPSMTVAKILSDTLSTWAEQTVDDKGVSLYDISILSSGMFADINSDASDYLVRMDLIRGKLNSVIANIDELEDIPGAKVIRTNASKRSLGELRVRLSDLIDYRLRPLIATAVNNHISRNPSSAQQFLQSQLTFTELEAQEARQRADTVRSALEQYVQDRESETQTASPSTPAPTAAETVVIDQSFIDRVVTMTNKGNDLGYRQRLVDDYRSESQKVVPIDGEARYYKALLDSFRGSARPPTAAEAALFDSESKAIVAEAVRTTNDVNEIYDRLSKDLNPATMLYAISGPVTSVKERAVSAPALLILGVILMLIAFPAIVLGAVLHERFRDADADAEAEDAAETEAALHHPAARTADEPAR
jgi:hypothetical protein